MSARILPVVAAAMVFVLASSAHSQRRRRGGDPVVAPLEVKLPFSTQFGELFLPKGKHRINLVGDTFAFINPRTMVTRGSTPAKKRTASTAVRRPKVKLDVKGTKVVVTVLDRDRVYEVVGAKARRRAPSRKADVKLSGKQEKQVQSAQDATYSVFTVIRNALKRYLKSVTPCADRAHRARWKTDDPRFAACVCPWTEKWKLPPAQGDLRFHQALARGKSGFSFTVTDKGRAKDCRVWVGAKPPADEQVAEGDATQPAAETASSPAAAAKTVVEADAPGKVPSGSSPRAHASPPVVGQSDASQ